MIQNHVLLFSPCYVEVFLKQPRYFTLLTSHTEMPCNPGKK